MKTLNQNEIASVNGGCGPNMFDSLFEGIATLFVGAAAAPAVAGMMMAGLGFYMLTQRR